MRSLGIDVGVGKGLDLVLMDERRVPLRIAPRVRPTEAGRLIEELRPDVIAVDGPPGWALSGRSRRTERALAEFNIQAFNTPAADHGKGNVFYDWMEVSFRVFRIAAKLGFPQVCGREPGQDLDGGVSARDGDGARRMPPAEGGAEAGVA